ncbi:competence type IV pilus minor pilin ComGG [Bacillus sp. NEB1478]|uniref:competence type IV pilus minor pilin ComGG n=1 Tax=Bacillus sp. NEB1478 TaxID=3073816 RepID=UPI002873980A|nr:competence type IV pilus minor pilin ComGG [Bacillus sp. NEB1478]WNB93561.1 competence type IV pilus minor pilin ComGG [Bacillus sp. NEB1478]
MNNQRGLIYPLIVILSFIVILFFGYLIERVYSERQFVYYEEDLRREERLCRQAVEKTADLLMESNESYPKEYYFTWNEGNVKVTVNKLNAEESLLQINAVTNHQHTKNVEVYYNVNQNRVTKWVEG